MARPIKILSINFPFKNPDVIQENRLSTGRALFDFDVVVIRPHDLGLTRAVRQASEWEDYQRLTEEFRHKREDLSRLLRGGKMLVVVLDALDVLEVDTGGYSSGELHTVTNYDFLHDEFFRSVSNGKGRGFDLTNQSEPFSFVLRSSRVEWTAFIGRSLPMTGEI